MKKIVLTISVIFFSVYAIAQKSEQDKKIDSETEKNAPSKFEKLADMLEAQGWVYEGNELLADELQKFARIKAMKDATGNEYKYYVAVGNGNGGTKGTASDRAILNMRKEISNYLSSQLASKIKSNTISEEYSDVDINDLNKLVSTIKLESLNALKESEVSHLLFKIKVGSGGKNVYECRASGFINKEKLKEELRKTALKKMMEDESFKETDEEKKKLADSFSKTIDSIDETNFTEE